MVKNGISDSSKFAPQPFPPHCPNAALRWLALSAVAALLLLLCVFAFGSLSTHSDIALHLRWYLILQRHIFQSTFNT